MSQNHVSLSEDRTHVTITSPEGHRATLRSARPGGFTDDDLRHAETFRFNTRMERGQVNRARRRKLGQRTLYAHLNVGPPTWWLPRVELRRNRIMVGWLRGAVALSWN